jgi:bifunctional UDP-N-acetylglucosamine pyrophosphorylase/glucosamine-1-phosphate N-acetyltransferase
MSSSLAKVLHCLGGRPLISYPLAVLRAIGVDPIVVVVGHQADAVQAACAPYQPRFALQAEQRGTGHATRVAQPQLSGFQGDLLLVYGDLPFLRPESLRRLIAAHQGAAAAVSLLTARVDNPTGFGRIVRDPNGHIARIVEERDASESERAIHEVNVGVYCAGSRFLFEALERLQPTNAQKELYLTDIVALARARGASIADATGENDEGTQISNRADLAACEQALRARLNARWMTAGVTLEDPATTYIGPDVSIGRDTVIGPNVILRGGTRIGEGCRFDGSSLVIDADIGNRVHVKFAVVITAARIEDEAQVGPFAQLRPGTHLGPRVHIGDFVETKNAVLGAGTKANHLAYLGDTEIGRDSNIGAGTITCNYDGFRKHRTIIGNRVQVGSDSTLVAPITIGDDAYLATATTVRADVPAGALAFNPREQVHRPGWVAARRAREDGLSLPPAAPDAAASRRGRRPGAKAAAPARAKPRARRKRSMRSASQRRTRT